jgi:primosomal protein N' (replication factor Y)
MNLYNATMHYAEILVADQSYHGLDALTYGSEEPIYLGSLAFVPLRNKQVLGVIIGISQKKPSFKTRPITSIVDAPALPNHQIMLLQWMRKYYPAPLGIIVQQFLPKTLPKRAVKPLDSHQLASDINLPPLTKDQIQAITGIQDSGLHVLHGATGTGKTRVYVELARKAYEDKRSTIVLTPEIGLTSQLALDFKKVFGKRVIVIHSQLSESIRHKLWLTILKETEPLIVIGPRSSLFSPIQSLGLVIVDESHETAYKQDQSPYYHTSHVAGALGNFAHIPVILGSATPLVADYFVAEQKNRPIIRMTQTATGTIEEKAKIHLVDLRDKSKFTKKPHISDDLIKAIQRALSRKDQVLLFLNRRGTARVVLCENCGWQALCPHCDTPLIYHSDSYSMRCHSCNFSGRPPVSCPECKHPDIIFKSVGTKAIAEEVAKLFPEATVQRFDTDNKKLERIEHHYEAVRSGEVDILIGTQTLAKGLDLPKLGLVGVIIADTSLFVPDFSSQERTYQLLSQVVGRVGRGHRKGEVIIQTYNPTSPLLRSVLTKDWDSFYNTELDERQKFIFPPYCYLLKIWCKRATQKGAEQAAQKLAKELRGAGHKIIVEGPAPSFHEKNNNKYQWQLIIKAKQRSELLKVIKMLPANWYHDIDPMNLL